MYGLGGKVAWVDLSLRQTKFESTERYSEFVGGRGLGSYLVFREVPPSAHALDSENIITFNTGPLTGTLAPSSGRLSISTKNVATSGICFANAGGHFAPEMKYAGFDHLIIKGRSEQPVYLFLHDGQVEIRSATHLWGKDIWQTEEIIRKELSDPKLHVAAIGQAGEKLVTMACIMVDLARAAGWGGCGAVMGSKNVKAVVVRGKGAVDIFSPDHFLSLTKSIWQRMEESNIIRLFRKYGLLGTSGAGGIDGTVAQSIRNMEDEVWEADKTLQVREIIFKEKYETRRLANFSCPVNCSHFYHVKTGKFAGQKLEALKTNVYRAFGTNIDLADREYILKANEMANRYGINCDSLSASVAWAIDVYQKGLIGKEITDGLDLKWGDGDLQLKLFDKIAFREGFGDLLAKGVYQASRLVGNGTERFAMHVKGQGMCEQAVRSHKGWALGIVTSSRGGGHLAGAPNTEQRRMSPEEGERFFGVPSAGEPTAYEGKGKLVAWFEKYKLIADMAGLCTSTTYWLDTTLIGPEDFAELINAATGWEFSGEDLLSLGEKVYNIEKAFNTIHAQFTRDDDKPPFKLREIPVSSGEFTGEVLDTCKWEEMLDEYYLAHKWDKETGLQTRDCLYDLGLQFVAERLERSCNFPEVPFTSQGPRG